MGWRDMLPHKLNLHTISLQCMSLTVLTCFIVLAHCAYLQHWPLAEQIHLWSATVVVNMREQRFQSTQWQSDLMLSLD